MLEERFTLCLENFQSDFAAEGAPLAYGAKKAKFGLLPEFLISPPKPPTTLGLDNNFKWKRCLVLLVAVAE